MSYTLIQLPFSIPFREMSKQQLDAYVVWFHRVLPGRVAELTDAVRSTASYESWEPDASLESLEVLGRWFESQVETRTRTPEEIEEIRARLTFPIDIPGHQLTNRTFSLAIDIGLYFSQVLLKNLPGTRWDQLRKDRRDADYGQPVLVDFAWGPLNPLGLIEVVARKIAKGKPARLRELYDVWAENRK
jgi:hypothetical protein